MSDQLRLKLEVIQKDMAAIQAASKATGKDVLDTTEAEQFDAKAAEFDRVEAQIKREEKQATITAKLATPQPRPVIEVIDLAPRATATNGGFRHFAEFLGAVRNSAYGKLDPRLQNAITTYGNETVGPEGGFSVPTDFRAGIVEAWGEDDNLMRLFSPISTNSNMLTLVSDETTPWASSGITGAWTDEAGTITASKPVLKQVNIPLRKVAALCHVSDELAEDSPAIASYVARKMGQKLASLVSQAIISGDGVGKPLGLIKSPAYIQVTRTTGHKVKAEDVTNMVARLRPGGYGKAFWLTHSTVLPQLWTMVLGGSTAATPVYATDYTKSPFGTLLGRPIYVTEYTSDLTDPTTDATSYDLLLVNPDGYILAVKSSGVQTASSIHFGFDAGLQSFRATMRVGGQGLLSAAVTRNSGSATLSDCVGLGHTS
jgi:HK97 family phage major capsid protein